MNPNQIGDTAELAVASDLTKQGYRIAFPFGDWGCDILATKDEKNFIRIQVKSSYIRHGTIVARTCTQNREGKRTVYTKEQCDWIAIYSPEMNTCYYIPVDDNMNKTAMALRIAETKNNQQEGITWAKDYTNLGD